LKLTFFVYNCKVAHYATLKNESKFVVFIGTAVNHYIKYAKPRKIENMREYAEFLMF